MKGSLGVEEFLAKAYAIVHIHDQVAVFIQ
jgi:hypothetical protein